eukprot:6355790-Karenia_brevis.AAC.1
MMMMMLMMMMMMMMMMIAVMFSVVGDDDNDHHHHTVASYLVDLFSLPFGLLEGLVSVPCRSRCLFLSPAWEMKRVTLAACRCLWITVAVRGNHVTCAEPSLQIRHL